VPAMIHTSGRPFICRQCLAHRLSSPRASRSSGTPRGPTYPATDRVCDPLALAPTTRPSADVVASAGRNGRPVTACLLQRPLTVAQTFPKRPQSRPLQSTASESYRFASVFGSGPLSKTSNMPGLCRQTFSSTEPLPTASTGLRRLVHLIWTSSGLLMQVRLTAWAANQAEKTLSSP